MPTECVRPVSGTAKIFTRELFDKIHKRLYNYNIMNKSTTIKIWKSTRKNLRLLFALTGKSMVSIMDRLVADELERIQQKKTNGNS
jgi:hypothetical protein